MGCCGGGHHQQNKYQSTETTDKGGFKKAILVFGAIALLSVFYYLLK